jgi:AAA+ ATPase superfamily predicted ATPase
MKKLTANPFKFGDPVQGDYYLPRPKLASLVRQFLDNRIHVVLMGPRRFGKTSFVMNLLSGLEKDGYKCILVDIFNITSHRDFLQQMLRAVLAKRDFKDKLKSFWKRIGRFVPQVTADFEPATGGSSFGFSVGELEEEDVKAAIQDLLEELTRLGKKVIVTLDEFQKISEIDD